MRLNINSFRSNFFKNFLELPERCGKPGCACLFELFARAVTPQCGDPAHPRIEGDAGVRFAVADKRAFGGREAHGERRIACERGIGLAGKHAAVAAHKVEIIFGEKLTEHILRGVLRLVRDDPHFQPPRLDRGEYFGLIGIEAGELVAARGEVRTEIFVARIEIGRALRERALDEHFRPVAHIGACLRIVDFGIAMAAEHIVHACLNIGNGIQKRTVQIK